MRRLIGLSGAALALCLITAPVAAQGGPKRYAVTHDKALAVVREVLTVFVETPPAILLAIDIRIRL